MTTISKMTRRGMLAGGAAALGASALAAGGVPHAYVLFEGESHGFRRAENIAAALEAELSFLGQILGFDPSDDIDPVALQT